MTKASIKWGDVSLTISWPTTGSFEVAKVCRDGTCVVYGEIVPQRAALSKLLELERAIGDIRDHIARNLEGDQLELGSQAISWSNPNTPFGMGGGGGGTNEG